MGSTCSAFPFWHGCTVADSGRRTFCFGFGAHLSGSTGFYPVALASYLLVEKPALMLKPKGLW
jgi:hypothetical protein